MTNPFYNSSATPAAQTRGASSPLRNEYGLVQAGFDAVNVALAAKASATGQVWSGAQDFSGSILRVATPVNITDAVTKQYVDGLAFSAALPAQSGNSGKVVTTNGTSASWTSLDSRGYAFLDKGNSGTTAQAVNFATAEVQRIAVSGAFTLTTSGWVAGRLCEAMIELVNGAAFAITWPTINWVKTDGSFTTTFSANGVTLQTSGTDFVLLWSRDGGATIYGKVVR